MTRQPSTGLLVVDDDELILELLVEELAADFDVVGARSRSEATRALQQLGQPPAGAIIDLGLPPHTNSPREGIALIHELNAIAPKCAIIVISGQNEREHGKLARAMGAIDYVTKPCDPEQIRTVLDRAFATQKASGASDGLLGKSAALTRLLRQIRQFGTAPYPVLIEGESGTGKELTARGLHKTSQRSGNFIAVNCAALPEQLFEASLFGAKRGAYTGATSDSEGYFAAASGGTLLLDEIGDLPLNLQPKLLRVLEQNEFFRVGDSKPRISDVRILASTNQPLRAAVSNKTFREDLFHRLSVLAITTPPLRELGSDLKLLFNSFRDQAVANLGTDAFVLDDDATQVLKKYHFPGNVRELRNIVARLQILFSGATVSAAELDEQLLHTSHQYPHSLVALLDQDARKHALAAYAACGDHLSAARQLQISEQRLRELLADQITSADKITDS